MIAATLGVPMTPSLSSPKRRRANNVTLHDQSLAHQGDVPSDFASTGRDMSTVPDERSTVAGEALAELRKIQRKIQSECRNVGTNFAEEARKIHYGESEPETYMVITRKEAESLAEEGMWVLAFAAP